MVGTHMQTNKHQRGHPTVPSSPRSAARTHAPPHPRPLPTHTPHTPYAVLTAPHTHTHLVLCLLAVVHARHLGGALVQVAHKRKRVHVALARLRRAGGRTRRGEAGASINPMINPMNQSVGQSIGLPPPPHTHSASPPYRPPLVAYTSTRPPAPPATPQPPPPTPRPPCSTPQADRTTDRPHLHLLVVHEPAALQHREVGAAQHAPGLDLGLAHIHVEPAGGSERGAQWAGTGGGAGARGQ